MAPAPAERRFTVPPELAGERLDRVVVALAPDLTRSAAQRLLKDGAVLLEGAPARPSDKAAAGQTLRLLPPTVRPLDVAPEDVPLDVVFEDEHLLVINKPPGMVVHPAAGHDSGTLVNALLAHCQLSSGTGQVRPGLVHRLDRDTSGLLLVAKNDAVHAKLTRLVETRAVKRLYLALVWGHPQPPADRIETMLGRHPQHRTMMAVLPEGHGRQAVTDYETRAQYSWSWQERAETRPRQREAALVQCVLQTGRTHQIRVHLTHRGWPLLGDPVYGDAVRDSGGPEALRTLVAALPGQALHAAELSFAHPVTGETVALQAPAPPAWQAVQQWLAEHGPTGR